MLELTGNLIPLPTPFTDDGSTVSEVRLARCIGRLLEMGADGFVVGADAGEFGALSMSERKHLLEMVAQNVPAGTPIVAHVTTMGTTSSLELAQHAANVGARAAVIMPPFYGCFSDAEIQSHIQSVARHAHLPIILVDPQARIDGDLAKEIALMPGVKLSEPVFDTPMCNAACLERSTSDEFALGNLYALPMAFFGRIWESDDEPTTLALRELMNVFGVARVAKFASDWLGVELGPVRGPLQPLPAAAREALHRLYCVPA